MKNQDGTWARPEKTRAEPGRTLLEVGSIYVPRLAFKHQHVREALALAMVFAVDGDRIERVIGTENKKPPPCQLYGWAPNVGRHTDRTGFVYFTPLLLRRSRVFALDWRRGRSAESIELCRGRVYRLYDYADHWTRDSAPVVCALTGPMRFPDDSRACAQLQVGVVALACGERTAPRVSEGFRVPLRGEVYAAPSDGSGGTELVLLQQARATHMLIARCALCDQFAVKVDKYFPYHTDMSRCRVHLGAPPQTLRDVTTLEAA